MRYSTPWIDYNCRIGGVYMRKLLVLVSVVSILVALVQLPRLRSCEDPLADVILAGEMTVLPAVLEYPGGVDLQLRLAQWYNLNLRSDEPEPGFRDAYPELLRAVGGGLGYIVLGNGMLTYPVFHEQTVEGTGFVHDSYSSFPVNGSNECTVLWFSVDADNQETFRERFALMPGDCLKLYILDQEFTYTVLEEADVKECASVLKLIFPLTDGQNLTICCQCMKSDTYY